MVTVSNDDDYSVGIVFWVYMGSLYHKIILVQIVLNNLSLNKFYMSYLG